MADKTYKLLMPMQVDSTTRLEKGDPIELDAARAKQLIAAKVVADPSAKTTDEKAGGQTTAPGTSSSSSTSTRKTAAERKAEQEKAAAEKAEAERKAAEGGSGSDS